MRTTRWGSMCAACLLVLGACGSDAGSSAGSTAGEVSVTSATDSTAVVDTTAVSEPVESVGPDPTTESTDDSATDNSATDDSVLPIAIDDKAVCQSFSRIITTSIFTGFIGSGTGGEAGGVERVEVVAYSSLASDAATLRSEVPANLQPGLEPLLLRIDAAPAALSAGGFSAAEIVTIASAWNSVLDAVAAGTPFDELPDAGETLDQSKVAAAAAAFEAAVGTFSDYSDASDSSDMDDEGNAWLVETCPLLAESLGGS